MSAPLYVTFLWHMHQPYYKNIETNKFILPWVRMHGVKDYYDMVSILDKYPSVKQNFNLVPSLLLQVEEYLEGVTDIFQDMTLKPASELNEDERVFVLFNFFMANWQTMVFPHPRYAYLLKKRGENSHPDHIKSIHKSFSEDEIRDLQVWFNLAWIDPDFFEMFPDLNELRSKGEGFTEEEKQQVMKRHMDILALIIPKYTEAWNSGKIELSTTPFYHPILPLVYDVKTAEQCMPKMPRLDFEFSHPEDAEIQIKKGIEYFEKKMGKRPVGMWPSEGSVSPEVMELVAKNGIKWAATDQEILYKSMWMSGKEHRDGAIYSPHTFSAPSGDVDMVFRNLRLSDMIGFNYHNWNPLEAANHFMKELKEAGQAAGKGKYAVNIILDGENAWEFYPNDGKDFLNALYAGIAADPDLETTTIGRMLESDIKKEKISKLWPGSWINHDFYIWIGHEDDRKSWKLLKKAREDLTAWEAENKAEKEKLKKAWESLYIAEGSDWNWWYGDDHSSKNDSEFDNLYRMHLMNIYKVIGRDIPGDFFIPITRGDRTFETMPERFIYPVIDGEDTDFYEWKGAGIFELSEGGAMHKGGKFFHRMHYGFNMDNFCLRMDSEESLAEKNGLRLAVKFYHGEKKAEFDFDFDSKKISGGGIDAARIEFAVKDIFEVKIPFDCFNEFHESENIRFSAELFEGGEELEKIPEQGEAVISVPGKDFVLYNWKA
ncbi:MAG: hypothetical protein ACLFP1_03945 [Candidatus Goldiibacteriota bacterium]